VAKVAHNDAAHVEESGYVAVVVHLSVVLTKFLNADHGDLFRGPVLVRVEVLKTQIPTGSMSSADCTTPAIKSDAGVCGGHYLLT